MGWKLAKAAYQAGLAGTISDRARLTLDHMCWQALDTPDHDGAAAEYWGGHLAISACLIGLDGTGNNTGRQAAKRAIAELIDAGLIEQSRKGVGKHRAVYRILVGDRWAPAKAVDNSQDEGLW